MMARASAMKRIGAAGSVRSPPPVYARSAPGMRGRRAASINPPVRLRHGTTGARFRHLIAHEGVIGDRAERPGLGAVVAQALRDGGVVQRGDDLRPQPVADRRRHGGRHGDAIPGGDIEIRHALFLQGGHIRHGADALRGRDAKRAQHPRQHLLAGGRRIVDVEQHLPVQHRGHRGRRAAIGHMGQFHAHPHAEQQAAQMRRRARPGRGEIGPRRVGAGRRPPVPAPTSPGRRP